MMLGLSEVLVMVAVAGVFLIIPLVALTVLYRVYRLRTQERLRAIEKGVPIPAGDPWERATRTRVWGIVFLAGGLGLLVFLSVGYFVANHKNQFILNMAFTAIPILLGLGLLYECHLRTRDLKSQISAGGRENR
jgi:hypothetical protein